MRTIKTATIHFTTAEGEDATQFDTHDVAELLELFHFFLLENKMVLRSVNEVELCEEKEK